MSPRFPAVTSLRILELTAGSMAAGLGVTPEEWEGLKRNVDDSFWVMRLIGSWVISPFALALRVGLV